MKYGEEICGMEISEPKLISFFSDMENIRKFFERCKRDGFHFVIVIIPFPPKSDQRTYGRLIFITQ